MVESQRKNSGDLPTESLTMKNLFAGIRPCAEKPVFIPGLMAFIGDARRAIQS